MNQVYIAPLDYTPRSPGELSISRNDYIVVLDIDDGWCLGENVTQGGQKGIFPKLYLGTSRTCTSSFNRATDDVAILFSRVDMMIAKSPYLTSEKDRESLLKRKTTLHSLGSFSYLTCGCSSRIWEDCLHNFLSAFSEAKVKAHDYIRCVENLKRVDGMLDKYIPGLTNEVQKYARILPAVLRNAECMQATIKSLITTALRSFDLYSNNNYQDQKKPCPLRLPERSTTCLTGSSVHYMTTGLDVRPATADTLVTEHIHPNASPFRVFLTCYPTLVVMTFLTCLVACCLQFRSYVLSPHGPGRSNNPDFYNNLQSTLMQLLTTYTGLVPAIRNRTLRGLISVLWVSGLSVAGMVLNFAALGVYFHDEGMAPLLGFFGNVVQTITVLQLAIRIQVLGFDDVHVAV